MYSILNNIKRIYVLKKPFLKRLVMVHIDILTIFMNDLPRALVIFACIVDTHMADVDSISIRLCFDVYITVIFIYLSECCVNINSYSSTMLCLCSCRNVGSVWLSLCRNRTFRR